MYCQNRMVHTVQEGDSLYRLARSSMSARGKATYRPREAAQTPGTRETAEAPETPVMLEMVEIPVMPAWAETSVSEW